MFPHLSTGSRPTRHRTRVFLGVREHDLPTFPVPIRIVVSTRFHLLPPLLPCFHPSPPVPGRLATGLGFFWASVNTTYRLSPYPSESLFPHVSTCSRGRLEMFRHHSTPLHRFPADSPLDSGFLGVRELYLPTFLFTILIDVSSLFHWFPLVSTRFDTIPHLSPPYPPSWAASPPDPVLSLSRH